MYGAIIGDIAGSIYEYPEFRDKLKGNINIERRLEILNKNNLINDSCFYSDDTILTIAILDSIINNASYEEKLREYGLKYGTVKLNKDNYFNNMFSPGFIKWCKGNCVGTSYGNGAIMRVSPVGYLFNSLEEVKENAKLAAYPSHNNELAIKAAEIVAVVIFLARNGYTKKELLKYLKLVYHIELNYYLEILQRTNTFDGTCNVLEKCLFLLLNSDDFDSAIKNTISIGGDTDTMACIVGSMAEAMYGGVNKYKEEINKIIPVEFKQSLDQGYKRILSK